MNNEIKLDTKLVGDITGDFYVPSYQRGYRWGETEVVRLLDDIYSTEGKRNYCLQPVVVRKNGDRYELIDGQQRLTTIYLIYRFMNEESFGFIDEPRFTLSYETREKSEEFLKSIDESRKEENIDFWFLCAAYESIKKWFSARDRKSTLTNVNKYFDEIVKIIWYEVGEAEDAIGLFTRLNIGKIPLTNAELVKAMFLSKDTDEDVDKEKQEEISLQWDNMEKELHNNSLWYFLTNKANADYQTRIDLVLDLISGKPADTESHGEIVEQADGVLYVRFKNKDVDYKNTSLKYELDIVAANVLYHWSSVSAAPATQYGSDVCRLIVASLPSIVNRRKYVRMPVNNKCTVTFKGGADVYEGTMVNISANGFAFQTRETEFADCKGENIIVKVPDFPVEQGRVLEGTIIRSTDNAGTHIVGCRMPEDRIEIGNYVSRNYSE